MRNGNETTCRACPMYDKGWCKVKAKMVNGNATACEYGKELKR